MFATHLSVSSSSTGVGQVQLDFGALDLYANPGDEFVLAVETVLAGSGTGQVAYSIYWTEKF